MTGNQRLIAVLGTIIFMVTVTAVIQVAIPSQSAGGNESALPTSQAKEGEAQGPLAPDFVGITQWINSQPLSLGDLKGKVVLVDFWTYSCINCRRTQPYLQDWNTKYSGSGLVIVGVHSPEFEFEKVESNVRDATVRQRVSWPVAMDNDFATWRAYRNRYWPHKFLIDHNGVIRYDHIGEGAYEETERQIRNLLTEAGYEITMIPAGGVEVGGAGASVTQDAFAGGL